MRFYISSLTKNVYFCPIVISIISPETMSFAYLNDLFGKFRKGKKTKFSNIEKRAVKSFISISKGKISFDDFYTDFQAIVKEFYETMGGRIDEETPLWLNSFSSNIFLRWQKWHVLKVMHEEKPEEFADPAMEAQYRKIESMNYDQWLIDKIRHCLKELD